MFHPHQSIGPALNHTIHPGPFFSISFLSLISLFCTSLYLASRAVVCSLPEAFRKRMQRSYLPIFTCHTSETPILHCPKGTPVSSSTTLTRPQRCLIWQLVESAKSSISPNMPTGNDTLPWDAMEVEGMVASLRFSSEHPKWMLAKNVCKL